MKTIFSKIFLGYLIIILLFTVTVLYFSFELIRDNEQRSLIQTLTNMNYSIEEEVKNLLVESNFSELDSFIKSLGKKIEYRITIINLDGKVLADSKADPLKMENHYDRPEIIKALSSGKAYSIRHSHTVNKDMLYVAVPIKSENKVIGISRMSIYMDDVDNLINTYRSKILQIFSIVVLISLIITLIFTRSITNPIKTLTSVSQYVSEGNFNVKAILKNNDEFRLLADSFNNMIARIKFLFDKTNQQNEEFGNIIASIKEGLVVLDSQGKIILSNDSFQKMFNTDLVIDKFYWEVIRENQVNKLVKKMQESDINLNSEIQIKDDYFICSANQINAKKEIVLIFYNISELKKLEIIKKDFVVNVSHELRTPLTVIKGYVETIEEDIDESNRKYIEIIKNHTDRLINIVNDLLSVSMLEEKYIKLDLNEINLQILFNNLSYTFDQKLKSKNLSIKCNIDNDIETIMADEFKLEQLFINLIDNAIKYTEQGGIIINVIKDNTHIKFEVIDTGIGIPEKDKERIFERFYTVDKSRSRQLAGTGLGLSIVKHIVLLHKGKINVESTLGEGSKFIIFIPIIN